MRQKRPFHVVSKILPTNDVFVGHGGKSIEFMNRKMNNVRKEDRLFSTSSAEHSNIFVGTNSISTCSELIGWEICRCTNMQKQQPRMRENSTQTKWQMGENRRNGSKQNLRQIISDAINVKVMRTNCSVDFHLGSLWKLFAREFSTLRECSEF